MSSALHLATLWGKHIPRIEANQFKFVSLLLVAVAHCAVEAVAIVAALVVAVLSVGDFCGVLLQDSAGIFLRVRITRQIMVTTGIELLGD